MALGKRRREQQGEFWIATEKLCNAPRNAFYDRLNQLLDEIRFDEKLEKAAEPYYEKTGRKGLAPAIYFRMIFIGYFEDISSQRGIAWRCADSRSLAKFLGYTPDEPTPDHSTLSLTRDRLPMEIHIQNSSLDFHWGRRFDSPLLFQHSLLRPQVDPNPPVTAMFSASEFWECSFW